MGLEGEMKKEEDEVERKIIHEIVEHLPLVPDKARTRARARARGGGSSAAAPTNPGANECARSRGGGGENGSGVARAWRA
jgi:hypothetical protein